jgi:hypothetical protein
LSKRDFEKYVVEAVDESLSSLGNSSKQAIYFHLEKSFSIKRQEIPNRINDFADALEKIFGLGANFLEILIIERLNEKTGQNIKHQAPKSLTLAEYVKTVENNLSHKGRAAKIEGEVFQCKEITVE